MKKLQYLLAFTAGLLWAAGYAGLTDEEPWKMTRIIPGALMGLGMTIGLIRQSARALMWATILGYVPLLLVLVILETQRPSSVGFLTMIAWASGIIGMVILVAIFKKLESDASRRG